MTIGKFMEGHDMCSLCNCEPQITRNTCINAIESERERLLNVSEIDNPRFHWQDLHIYDCLMVLPATTETLKHRTLSVQNCEQKCIMVIWCMADIERPQRAPFI